MTGPDLSAYYASLTDEELSALAAQPGSDFTADAWRLILAELAQRGLKTGAGPVPAAAAASKLEHPPLDPSIMRAVIACAAVGAWLLVELVQSRNQMAHTTIMGAVSALVVAGLIYGLYRRSPVAAWLLLFIAATSAWHFGRRANFSSTDNWAPFAISVLLMPLLARAARVISRVQPFPPPPRE